MRKTVSSIIVFLLVMGTLELVLKVQPARADGPIYIMADGSISSGAPISTLDKVTYTLTGNVTSSGYGIIVERDNVTIEGAQYTVQGTGNSTYNGIDLTGRSNVAVKNTTINSFSRGIYLSHTSNTALIGNNITNNGNGIHLTFSSNNSISGNNITNNNVSGIYLGSSFDNDISGNNITNNGGDGVTLDSSSDNSIEGNNVIGGNHNGILLAGSSGITIAGNNITNNYLGIFFLSSNDKIYHNNFISNGNDAYLLLGSTNNTWDWGYPWGGNFWSDYNGTDNCGGPNQTDTGVGSDGIGDEAWHIDINNRDGYPLMRPWYQVPGDIDFDGKVKLADLVLLAKAYGSKPGDTKWNPNADIDGNGVVGLNDLVVLAQHYGEPTHLI